MLHRIYWFNQNIQKQANNYKALLTQFKEQKTYYSQANWLVGVSSETI
jgi:hypothetical protein